MQKYLNEVEDRKSNFHVLLSGSAFELRDTWNQTEGEKIRWNTRKFEEIAITGLATRNVTELDPRIYEFTNLRENFNALGFSARQQLKLQARKRLEHLKN
jgi:hypothetical protein